MQTDAGAWTRCANSSVRICRKVLRQGDNFVQETTGNRNAAFGFGTVDIISRPDIVAL